MTMISRWRSLMRRRAKTRLKKGGKEGVAEQEDSAEAVSGKIEKEADATAADEPAPVAEQEDSAEAVSGTAEKTKDAATHQAEPIAEQEDSAEAVSAKAEK